MDSVASPGSFCPMANLTLELSRSDGRSVLAGSGRPACASNLVRREVHELDRENRRWATANPETGFLARLKGRRIVAV